MKPDSAKNDMATETLAAVKRGFRNRTTSSIGFGVRRSAMTKMVSSPAPPAMVTSATGDCHPQPGASITPNTSTAMPAIDSANPRQSSGGVFGSRDVRTERATRAAITPATRAINTNTLPHQNRPKSHPPTIGPMAIPTPVVAPHNPMAWARSLRSVNTFTSNERVDGNMSAAPSPITAREPMSSPVVPDAAPARLPAAKTASPMSSVPFRPNRSLRLPAAKIRAAKTRL